ncbi:MAG TPA: hypothetical protein VFZ51_11045, partial [Woeseiaceae bacterium]
MLRLQYHPPHYSSPDGRIAVQAKINAERPPNHPQYLSKLFFLVEVRLFSPLFRTEDVRMATYARQLTSYFLGRQDEIHSPAVGGAFRHAVVLGRTRILGKSEAAGGLDFGKTQRAVGPGPGEDHSDGHRLPVVGQRAKKIVERQVLATRLVAGLESKAAL